MMRHVKILIVEDDKDLAAMYRLKFEKEWFDTKVTDNGLDAITLVTEFEPNVVLLDIMMPGMDGFETLRVIRELAPSLNCKIIMFSNLNKKEHVEKCMDLGADAYLLKANTTPKEAVAKIRELILPKDPVCEKPNQASAACPANHHCPHCWKEIHLDIKLTA